MISSLTTLFLLCLRQQCPMLADDLLAVLGINTLQRFSLLKDHRLNLPGDDAKVCKSSCLSFNNTSGSNVELCDPSC